MPLRQSVLNGRGQQIRHLPVDGAEIAHGRPSGAEANQWPNSAPVTSRQAKSDRLLGSDKALIPREFCVSRCHV